MSKEQLISTQNMLTAVGTLESLALTEPYSGARGQNRASGRSQLSARDDREAVLAWIARFADSPATLASYRKEAERLMLWSVVQHQKALSDLTHEDFLVYQHFLSNPQPAERWVMPPGAKLARSAPGWRPFAGPLGENSRRLAMSIINSLFSWLVEAGYLAGNPLALRRRQRSAQPPRVIRFLPRQHWQALKCAILSMPTDTARKADRAARARWLFSLLYIGGLRVSEVCDGTMGNFFSRLSPDGSERWWLEVRGKGEKTRLIPATSELMDELMRYRGHFELRPLPSPGESLPVVLPLIGASKPLTRSAIHVIVKETVRNAADELRAQGPEFEAAAAHIERASTHWMRHTAATHQTDGADLKDVRDNLGHGSFEITNRYVHTEDDARHDRTSETHRASW